MHHMVINNHWFQGDGRPDQSEARPRQRSGARRKSSGFCEFKVQTHTFTSEMASHKHFCGLWKRENEKVEKGKREKRVEKEEKEEKVEMYK